jgi:uracil-DNA glycosylase family 4
MNWKKELIDFYKQRKEFVQKYLSKNVDFTEVIDPCIEQKKDNPIMLIGEAPGKKEVELHSPFVGKAGENLTYLISLSQLDRCKDFLITNAFPFRTYENNKNRTPKSDELKIGAKLLKKEIEIVKPSLILLLGNSAIRAFLYIDDFKEVKNLKKCGIYEIKGYKIGICFHPSPLAFNRNEIRRNLEEFFKNLVK